MVGRALAVVGALLALAGAPRAAAAAPLATTSWVDCLSWYECGQATLHVQFPQLADPTLIGALSFTLDVDAPWRFAATQAAEVDDASDLGFTFYTPIVSADQRTITGTFTPGFEALALPGAATNTLHLTIEFDPDQSPYAFYPYGPLWAPITYETLASEVTTAPEPGTWVLVGTGLVLLAAAARRGSRPSAASA